MEPWEASKYPAEVRERAVRLVFEQHPAHASQLDAEPLTKLGFALLYGVAAPRAAFAIFAACAARFPSSDAQSNLAEAELVGINRS